MTHIEEKAEKFSHIKADEYSALMDHKFNKWFEEEVKNYLRPELDEIFIKTLCQASFSTGVVSHVNTLNEVEQ